MSQNEFHERPMFRGFPHAFNYNVVIDEAMKIVSTWPYEGVTWNFVDYVNGLMYLNQAMIDSCTRVDHAHDFQKLQRLHESYHTQRESLLKEKKKRKDLEDYKK